MMKICWLDLTLLSYTSRHTQRFVYLKMKVLFLVEREVGLNYAKV